MSEEPSELVRMYVARAEAIRQLKIGAATDAARERLERAASYYDRLAERIRRDSER